IEPDGCLLGRIGAVDTEQRRTAGRRGSDGPRVGQGRLACGVAAQDRELHARTGYGIVTRLSRRDHGRRCAHGGRWGRPWLRTWRRVYRTRAVGETLGRRGGTGSV